MINKTIKNDNNKPRFDLLPPDALEEIAKSFTYGAEKYEERNWEKTGFDWHRLYSAAQRHLNSFWSGENDDKESKCNHLACACANIMMLLSHSLRNIGKDDRLLNTKEEKIERVKREKVCSFRSMVYDCPCYVSVSEEVLKDVSNKTFFKYTFYLSNRPDIDLYTISSSSRISIDRLNTIFNNESGHVPNLFNTIDKIIKEFRK